ncbi:MAG: hypothetical protein D6816_16990 [Bacteroidetes bacterium]|nr:MAG: hypothetical protein D6816_16990 [Bacteroidota bacterium]
MAELAPTDPDKLAKQLAKQLKKAVKQALSQAGNVEHRDALIRQSVSQVLQDPILAASLETLSFEQQQQVLNNATQQFSEATIVNASVRNPQTGRVDTSVNLDAPFDTLVEQATAQVEQALRRDEILRRAAAETGTMTSDVLESFSGGRPPTVDQPTQQTTRA